VWLDYQLATMYPMPANAAPTTASKPMITIGDLGGFGGTSDITSFLNVASPTPLGVGAGPSLERGGVSFHAPLM
jgi:hypothetical protein